MSELADIEVPGADARQAPGPVHHKGPGPAPAGWLDPRGRAVGGRAFALHRLTGLALIFYLYVHLGILSMLLIGRSAWSSFLGVVTATGFIVFDVVLILGVLIHGLNGIRVALVGSGFLVGRQRALFWAGMGIGAAGLAFTILHETGVL